MKPILQLLSLALLFAFSASGADQPVAPATNKPARAVPTRVTDAPASQPSAAALSPHYTAPIAKVDVVPVWEFESVVIPIKHALAGQIAQVLGNMTVGDAGASASGGSDNRFILANARIITDQRINALLIFASKSNLMTISNIIDKLDVVHIEPTSTSDASRAPSAIKK